MIAGYTEMDTLVREACMEVGDDGLHNALNMYRYGTRLLQDMNLGMDKSPEYAYLTPDPTTKTVTLPEDYVNYVAVGIEHNGIFWALGYNPRMCRPKVDDCGEPVLGDGGLVTGTRHQIFLRNSEDEASGAWYGNYWTDASWWPNYGQQEFGLGGGYNTFGYYKVVPKDGVIMFNPSFNWGAVVLIYIKKAYCAGKKTLVPEMMTEALLTGMIWKFFQFKKNTTIRGEMRDYGAKAEDYRQRHFAERRMAGQRMRNNTHYEILAAYRRSTGNFKQ